MRRPALALVLALLASEVGAAEGVSLTAAGRDGGPPHPGAALRLDLTLDDPATGYPLAGLHLRAWLRPARDGRTACVEAARQYLRNLASPRREIELDAFDVLALDEEDGLARLDPKLDLATANIVRLARLGARPADILLDQDAAILALALPDRVELRDALTLEPLASLPTRGPARLVQAEPGRLWIAAGGSGQSFDLRSMVPDPGIPLDAASLAYERDEAWLIAGGADGRLTVHDGRNGSPAAEVELGRGIAALALLPGADVVYALTGKSLEAHALPDLAPAGRVELPFAASRLATTADEHWLLALDPISGALAVVEAATARLAHLLVLHHLPDQMLLDETIAWFRQTGSGDLAVLSLDELGRESAPGLSLVTLGRTAPGPADLPMLAAVPGGHGVLAASPEERAVFLFHAGMMAASRSIPAKSAVPRAIAARDRAFRETAPGRYAAWLETPAPGEYELVLWRDRPAGASCHPLAITGEPVTAATRLEPAPSLAVSLPPIIYAGTPAPIALGLRDGEGRPLALATEDASFLVMPAEPGSWQARGRLHAEADGIARISIIFPGPGPYRLLVQAPSAGLGFRPADTIPITVSAGEDTP